MTQNRTLITGANGFVGTALAACLTQQGQPVSRLVRVPSIGEPASFAWNPARGELDRACFEGVDQVVHLAGDNIASGRWTAEKRARILDSRTGPTRLLCEAMAQRSSPPRVLVSASAVGYYGDRGQELLNEDSTRGAGFLSDVCQAWELATEPARRAGIRCVLLRIGMVLSNRGGALPRMVLAFRWGLGGRIGSGRQFISWITLADLLAAIQHCFAHQNLSGPVNAVAPSPVTNAEFTAELGRTLHRPTLFPLPAGLAKLLLGDMAEAVLLSSAQALPARLLQSGFVFDSPTLPRALGSILVGSR